MLDVLPLSATSGRSSRRTDPKIIVIQTCIDVQMAGSKSRRRATTQRMCSCWVRAIPDPGPSTENVALPRRDPGPGFNTTTENPLQINLARNIRRHTHTKKLQAKKDHQDEKIHLCKTKRDDCGLRVSLTIHVAHGSLAGRYFGMRFQIRRQSSERVRREVKSTTSNLDP